MADELSARVWYSALLSFIVDVQDEAEIHRSRSVILFRGPTFDSETAKVLAIARGRSMEQSYSNIDGKTVRWILERVETLDVLGEDLGDAREVYHEFSEYFARGEVDLHADPHSFEPGSSGV